MADSIFIGVPRTALIFLKQFAAVTGAGLDLAGLRQMWEAGFGNGRGIFTKTCAVVSGCRIL
jgi:hypothetical protein